MANINVQDLLAINPSGADLFKDPENFMTDLKEDGEQIQAIYGGVGCIRPSCVATLEGCWRNSAIETIFAV